MVKGSKPRHSSLDLIKFMALRNGLMEIPGVKLSHQGGRLSSMVSSVPTILRPQVQIPSTPSMLFFNLYY